MIRHAAPAATFLVTGFRARPTATAGGGTALTGRAAKGVARLLHEHGFDVVAEPESFLVTKQDRLEPQETIRAREWGARLAAAIAPTRAPGGQS